MPDSNSLSILYIVISYTVIDNYTHFLVALPSIILTTNIHLKIMKETLHAIFSYSIQQLIDNDKSNILSDINERNLCARLASYLENNAKKKDLKGYYADTEYNRNNGKIKTILDDRSEIITINCDIILHSRGSNIIQDNLIAIEMKKSRSPQIDKDRDRDRLRALTKDHYDDIWSFDGGTFPKHVCRYIVGYYIELDIRSKNFLIEEYIKGEKTNKWNIEFQ